MSELQKSISNWDPRNKHIYSKVRSDQFFGSDDVALVSMGTKNPEFTPDITTSQNLEFVGLLTAFTFTGAQSVTPVFEIGSSLAYYVAAQSSVSFQGGVLMWRGPSLLSRIYHDADTFNRNRGIPLVVKEDTNGKPYYYPANTEDPAAFFGIDFSDDVYSKPVGLLTIFSFINPGDPEQNVEPFKVYGAWFWENAFIANVAAGVNAGTTLINEGFSGFAENIYGVYVTEESKQNGQ